MTCSRMASSSAASSRCRLRRRTVLGCGRAATIVVYATRPTATSRRVRTRWRRLPRVGGGQGTELFPCQFEAWLTANAALGSIIAIGIPAMTSPDFILLTAAPDPVGFFLSFDHPPDTPIWGFTRQWRSGSTDGPQLEAVWRDALIKYRLFPPARWRDGVAFVSAISLDVVRSPWRDRKAEH